MRNKMDTHTLRNLARDVMDGDIDEDHIPEEYSKHSQKQRKKSRRFDDGEL